MEDVLLKLQQQIDHLSEVLTKTAAETHHSLSLIKASYVEDVLGKLQSLTQEFKTMITSSTERSQSQFETSVTNFVVITEKIEKYEKDLKILVEGQTDLLVTLADLRDGVNTIIQVELTALRERVAIYLETTVNELKTSVGEHMSNFQGAIHTLSDKNDQATQSIDEFPNLVESKLSAITQSQITGELVSLRNDIRLMTAKVINEVRSKPDTCPHCGKKIS